MTGARPRGVDSVKIIQVIETKALRGLGTDNNDPCREVVQYWDMEGNFLAENDSCKKEKRAENSTLP